MIKLINDLIDAHLRNRAMRKAHIPLRYPTKREIRQATVLPVNEKWKNIETMQRERIEKGVTSPEFV